MSWRYPDLGISVTGVSPENPIIDNPHSDFATAPMHYMLRNPGTHGFINPRDIEVQWKDQFEFFHREYNSFVFTLSLHPQVSGKSNILLMHERFMAWLKLQDGIEFMTMEQVCGEFKAGKLIGTTITAGV